MARKIVDPKTGARIADPEFSGMALNQGATGTNWPEVRNQYKKGLRNAEFNRPGVPAELKSYLTGETNKLSEEFSDPYVKPGGSVEYHRLAKTANLSEFDDTPKNKKMAKMPTNKAKINVPKGKLRGAVKEEYAFQPATKGTKTETRTNAAMTSGLTRAANPKGSLGAARVVTSEDKVVRGYKREKALFEAKAGASASGIDFSNMSASEINAKRQDLKQDRRDYRKSSLSSDIKLPSIKEATMDIRQSRKAETYSKKDTAGKLSHFTSGYKSNETPRAESRIEEFRGSMNNAANRNTMQSKLNAVSTKPKTNMY